jgi:predicted RNA-binding Zn-ribbon protein involved in translation (DUF1610 family)
MSNQHVEKKNIYGKATESFLFHQSKAWKREYGGKQMAKCPKCGTEVAKPKKTWKMAGRPDKAGKRMQLEIGLYECPKCGNVFREVLSKQKI